MADAMSATTKDSASSEYTRRSPMPSNRPDSAGPTMTPTCMMIWLMAAAATRWRRSTSPGMAAMRAVLLKPMKPAASALTT